MNELFITFVACCLKKVGEKNSIWHLEFIDVGIWLNDATHILPFNMPINVTLSLISNKFNELNCVNYGS